MARLINKIYLHCSDTTAGDAASIRQFHVSARGWDDIGYHYVVLNGHRSLGYHKANDGVVEKGRDENVIGAHVEDDNRYSLGICLIGKDGLFTIPQVSAALDLVETLMERHKLSVADVYGHYESPSGIAQGKTCPGFDIDDFLSLLVLEE